MTGAASLFRRDLLDDALPFPPRLARAFHDHWIAVVAMARGDLAYVDEPLYDYVQHDEAVIGHSQANRRPRSVRTHLMDRLRNPTGGSRVVYYYDWHQQLLFAEVLRLRCGQRMAPAKRRTLQRLLSADDRLAGLAWLLGRRTRRLWGHDETLDRELFYGYALARRRAVSAWTAGRRRPNRFLPRDVSIPPDPTAGELTGPATGCECGNGAASGAAGSQQRGRIGQWPRIGLHRPPGPEPIEPAVQASRVPIHQGLPQAEIELPGHDSRQPARRDHVPLAQQVAAAPAHQVVLAARSRAERRGVLVHAPGGPRQPAGATRPAQPQSQVDILEVGEDALVEAAGLEKGVAPVRGVGSGGADRVDDL